MHDSASSSVSCRSYVLKETFLHILETMSMVLDMNQQLVQTHVINGASAEYCVDEAADNSEATFAYILNSDH